jgi:hypothetical protein
MENNGRTRADEAAAAGQGEGDGWTEAARRRGGLLQGCQWSTELGLSWQLLTGRRRPWTVNSTRPSRHGQWSRVGHAQQAGRVSTIEGAPERRFVAPRAAWSLWSPVRSEVMR